MSDVDRPFRALAGTGGPVAPDPGFAARLRARLQRELLQARPTTHRPTGGPAMSQLTPYLVVRDARAGWRAWVTAAPGHDHSPDGKERGRVGCQTDVPTSGGRRRRACIQYRHGAGGRGHRKAFRRAGSGTGCRPATGWVGGVGRRSESGRRVAGPHGVGSEGADVLPPLVEC